MDLASGAAKLILSLRQLREFRSVASMDKAIHYHLYNDRERRVEINGKDTLVENGHMTYSCDGRLTGGGTNRRTSSFYNANLTVRV